MQGKLINAIALALLAVLRPITPPLKLTCRTCGSKQTVKEDWDVCQKCLTNLEKQ